MSSPRMRVKRPISRVSRAVARSANAELKKLVGADAFRDIQIRTGGRRGVLGPGRQREWPPPPDTWTGTLPEWAVYWAHLFLGLESGQEFEYLWSLGDVADQVDFYERDVNIVIEIQGLYWHYGLGAAKQLNDMERKIRIEARGFQVVFIDEDDALEDPVFYLREARSGSDHSRAGTGMI